MQVSMKLDRGIPVLSVEGRLDARGAAAFDETWKTVPPQSSHVVLDLSATDYLSSLGIRSLVSAEKTLHQRHGCLILAALSPVVTSLLASTGLLQQLEHVGDVAQAVEQARTAAAVEAASDEHAVDGRRYRITRPGTDPCFLELWGGAAEAPDGLAAFLECPAPGPAIDASLAELGWAFGEGALGGTRSLAVECIGPLVSKPGFAAALPPQSPPDFVVSHHPEEIELAIVRAVGFSGPPTANLEIAAGRPASLRQVLSDAAKLLAAPGPMGFVVEAPEKLIVGIYSPRDGKLFGHAVACSARLEDLQGIAPADAEMPVETAALSVYLPTAIRLGLEKRLKIEVDGAADLRDEWSRIIRRLYRDCSRVILTPLTGGYMATTFRVASYDQDGRRQLPTVLKISTIELIEREAAAHRAYVEKFILNNSTTIMGTATEGEWAALRYNFLGVSGPDASLSWALDYYRAKSIDEVRALFHRLYTQILKPWYGQPRWEPVPLYADHTPLRLFPNLCAHAQRDFGFSPAEEEIECVELGIRFPNPFRFLLNEYARRSNESRLWYQGITHGDLNLRNILVDEQENIYVIDFSETRPRNIVADFARMETILKFETPRVDSPDDIARLVEFEMGLAEARSLAYMPPNRYRGDDPKVDKEYAVICQLRQYADTVTLFETDIVPYWLALLEWTFSVLSYDLPPLRRKLAAYSAAIICSGLRTRR